LDQKRTFPNAIVLATDIEQLDINNGTISFPKDIRFMVVDGQHRLWAQRFSEFDARYACMIHLGLSEEEMARLFLEINDNQKRVPSSLRWDLVRLVRPEDDPYTLAAAEIVYLLATEEGSPLYQRIDLTGEQAEIQLKQGSIAPEIKRVISQRSTLSDFSFDDQYELLEQYFAAIRERDGSRWGAPESPFYKARVIRALVRMLPRLVMEIHKSPSSITYADFAAFLERIDDSSLDPEVIRAAQGNAGIKAVHDQLISQVLGG
jgi:DGQHR domain-containing protein